MVDLLASGVASRMVAERFGVNQRRLKRLLQQRGCDGEESECC